MVLAATVQAVFFLPCLAIPKNNKERDGAPKIDEETVIPFDRAEMTHGDLRNHIHCILSSDPSVAAWLVVSGIFSTGIIPACISAFSESVEEENKFLATSIAESGVNIGAFLGTPYIALIEAFGGSADTAMFISPIIMLILGFVTLRFCKKDAKM